MFDFICCQSNNKMIPYSKAAAGNEDFSNCWRRRAPRGPTNWWKPWTKTHRGVWGLLTPTHTHKLITVLLTQTHAVLQERTHTLTARRQLLHLTLIRTRKGGSCVLIQRLPWCIKGTVALSVGIHQPFPHHFLTEKVVRLPHLLNSVLVRVAPIFSPFLGSKTARYLDLNMNQSRWNQNYFAVWLLTNCVTSCGCRFVILLNVCLLSLNWSMDRWSVIDI